MRCTLHVTVNYQISSYKLSFPFLFLPKINQTRNVEKAGGMAVVCRPDSIVSAGLVLLTKLKQRSIIGRGKMKQQEQNSHCFLSQPRLFAHTLLARCHLSLSQALASSPTAPTRPGQHMPLPNIHLLPAGLPRV